MTKFIVLLSFLILFKFSNCDTSNSSLKLIHVFFRHGSRMPDEHEMHPNDPYQEIFRNQHGQLTNKGKQESFQLGKNLRSVYDPFLGRNFHPNVVLAKSTDTDRTKMTALLVLAGLFPPYNDEKWSDELNWLPVPVSYTKYNADYELVKADVYCPAYIQEVNRVLASEEGLQIITKYNRTLELISNYTGKPYRTMRDIFLFHQLLASEKYMNLTVPVWASNEFDAILYLTNMQCYFENYNTILKRLSGGRMLTRVISNMKAKIENTLQPVERKIFLYSCHDSNIIGILSSMHLYNFTFPNYNAAISIELHQDQSSKEHFVKVLYFEDANSQPMTVHLKDCGYSCSFKKFEEVLFPHLPLNYTKECEANISLD